MRAVFRSRTVRAAIAGVASLGWLVYMVIGLPVINAVAPTIRGEGPEGLAAFLGLIGGVITAGLVMWAASD